MPELDDPAAGVDEVDGVEVEALLEEAFALAAALRARAAATNDPPEEACVDEAAGLPLAPALGAGAVGRGWTRPVGLVLARAGTATDMAGLQGNVRYSCLLSTVDVCA